MPYYNTNRLNREELSDATIKTDRQKDRVLKIFQSENRRLSPDYVWKKYFESEGVPLTSVRRCITDLTDDDELEMTTDMIIGIYGKNVHTWRLRFTNPLI